MHKRSQDCPDVSDYPTSELNAVYAFYKDHKRKHGSVLNSDIIRKFGCSDMKARVLISASEFREKMEKKGLA